MTGRAIIAARLALILALLVGGVTSLHAQEAYVLPLPKQSRLALEITAPGESYALPIGPFAGSVPTDEVSGTLTTRVWRIAQAQGLTTEQIIAPLRARLKDAGFQERLSCADLVCGGFDFRFAIPVVPAPEMQVDIGNFRFLAAQRGDEALSLLVSRTGTLGFVQLMHIAPPGVGVPKYSLTADMPSATPTTPSETAAQPRSIEEALQTRGSAVLRDLSFESGKSTLSPGPYASLTALAAFLRAEPTRRIALVGHTDATGSLEGNIALSERRAAAVLERLVSGHGVLRAQLESRGVGYLAPLAANATEAGREANRRVEAVLLATK